MAGGDFLPPVVTRLEGDLEGLARTVEEAKKLIQSIGDTKIPVSLDMGSAFTDLTNLRAAFAAGVTVPVRFDTSGASLAGVAGAGALAGAAGGRRGGGRGIFGLIGGLGFTTIHNLLLTFGSQILADTAGLIAFGTAASATLGPVFSGFSTLQTSYANLDNYQKQAAVSLNTFVEGIKNSNEAGIVTVFNEGLNILESNMKHSGGIVSQATQAFMQFGAMLHTQFQSSIWTRVFGGVQGNVRSDMTAMFGLVNSLIGIVPVVIKDFNGIGLSVVHAASGTLNFISTIGDKVPWLVKFGALGFTAYKAWNWMGNQSRFGWLEKLMGLLPVGTGEVLAAAAAGVYLGIVLGKLPDATQMFIDKLAVQDQAVGYNIAGYNKLSAQTQAYANATSNAIHSTAMVGQALGHGLAVQQEYASASSHAAQNARTLAGNFQYLSNTYGMNKAQAIAAANATGINLFYGLQRSTTAAANARYIMHQYAATVAGAAAPTKVLALQMMVLQQDAGNLTKQGQDLTAMFNTLLTPFANTISSTVTWKNDNVALANALKKSSGEVGYHTARQRQSAQALAQSITDTEGLSSATLQQTHSIPKAIAVTQQEINVLKGLHSQSSLVAQAIKALQQYIDALHSKTITIGVNIAGNPNVIGGAQGLPGAGGVRRAPPAPGSAAGNPSAPPGYMWVGERGPELMSLRGGERIIPADVARGYAGGSGGTVQVHSHIYLDGKELFAKVKSQTYDYNARNGNRRRGGRMAGTLVPR